MQSDRIHTKETYHLESGEYLQFCHDHQEKTYDAWMICKDGSKKIIATQDVKTDSYSNFRDEVVKNIQKLKEEV